MMASIGSLHSQVWRVSGGFLFALLTIWFLSGTAFAQSTSNTQQDRMKACNAQAGQQSLSGDKRKSFMSDCLSGKTAQTTTPANAQQQKMKTCNTEATGKSLTGDARKTFMSSCLKG